MWFVMCLVDVCKHPKEKVVPDLAQAIDKEEGRSIEKIGKKGSN
jgi:hypothetical protein